MFSKCCLTLSERRYRSSSWPTPPSTDLSALQAPNLILVYALHEHAGSAVVCLRPGLSLDARRYGLVCRCRLVSFAAKDALARGSVVARSCSCLPQRPSWKSGCGGTSWIPTMASFPRRFHCVTRRKWTSNHREQVGGLLSSARHLKVSLLSLSLTVSEFE